MYIQVWLGFWISRSREGFLGQSRGHILSFLLGTSSFGVYWVKEGIPEGGDPDTIGLN